MFNYKFLNIKTEIKHNFSSKFFPTTFNSFASVKKEHIDSQESESSLALCKREREGEGASSSSLSVRDCNLTAISLTVVYG